MQQELARAYARRFHRAGAEGCLAFFKTPLGKKLIVEEPKALEEAMKRADDWANKFADEVVAKLRAEMKKKGHNLLTAAVPVPREGVSMAEEVDLFVIGAGSGGVRAARIASGYGAKVMIAEEYRVGGTCVIRGCVPKKLLVYASRFADEFEDAAGFGWTRAAADVRLGRR